MTSKKRFDAFRRLTVLHYLLASIFSALTLKKNQKLHRYYEGLKKNYGRMFRERMAKWKSRNFLCYAKNNLSNNNYFASVCFL